MNPPFRSRNFPRPLGCGPIEALGEFTAARGPSFRVR